MGYWLLVNKNFQVLLPQLTYSLPDTKYKLPQRKERGVVTVLALVRKIHLVRRLGGQAGSRKEGGRTMEGKAQRQTERQKEQEGGRERMAMNVR